MMDDDDDDLFNITLHETITLIKRTYHKTALTETDSLQQGSDLQANNKYPEFHTT